MNEELHLLPDAQRTGRTPVRTHAEPGADEAPLRAELFSAAQMAVHGRQLAARHELAHEDTPDRLLVRLAANAAVIEQACAALARAAGAGQALAPAAAMLLDHAHLVGEHVRSARRHLPPACGRILPRLAGGAPRIYQLALEVVTHGDGRLEQESLARFVAAYQEGAPLKLVELRTVPVMLRLALVDNLRRIAARLDARRVEHELAEGWAERLIATADNRPGDLVLLVADMARAVQPPGAGFVADLARRLQGQGAALAQVLEWIDARLADEESSIEDQIRRDSAGQAADRASIANSIASLRLVAAIDWREFVETMSAADATLRQDPDGTYARMDFASRDHYRHAVERLAQQSRHSEAEVAAEALALAHAGPAQDDADADNRLRHVGYYLVGDGLPALRARLRLRPGVLAGVRRAARRRPLLSWLGAIGAFTLLFVAALLVHAYIDGAGMPLLLALALLSVFGASQLALALVNAMTARLVRPQPLARMDFGAGIPPGARTLVAVPALLERDEQVAALCAGLEVRYLANRDPQLRFCLLGDFADAPQETMFEDAALLEGARAAIAALNARYADGGAGPFLLLQRARTWSDTEGAWIGRERRRGQLADLNALLRGGARERFALVEGSVDGLDRVRYVIALDAGTQLPHGAARQLVATMAHPLNRPLLDAAGSRVVAGHGLLQPRITTSLPVDDASRYERLCGGEPGIDLYTHTAPDVYQDLFGQGAWRGKGIYEVDTFARVLDARLPGGQLLAPEALEDGYLRAGVVSDVQVVEAYPARYSDDVGRRHRRIRGAWQVAGWLRARVPVRGGGRAANPLAPLARWKLFDALRRSLVAPTLVATLVLCWSLLPEPAFWSAAALAVYFLPAFLGMFIAFGDKPHDMLWRQHLANWWRGARSALGHAVTNMSFLPHEAWYSVDAIARSSWRMLVSKRRLLEWQSASLARSSLDLEANWRNMWFAPALAVGTAVLLTFAHPFALFAAAPLLLLWFLSPILAWWLSLPFVPRAPQLAEAQTRFLTGLARRTWGFFDTHAGPQHNWLPPATLQEHPQSSVLQHTSPTDIGLGLLASLAARDFGFIAQAELLARVRAAFDSMALLERHRGHFYSGYDTGTLAPRAPKTVSTVESGNLAGHLLTLAAGLEELADKPIAGVESLAGARATLQVIEEHAPPSNDALARCRTALGADSCRNADTLPGLADCLQAAAGAAAALLASLPGDADPEVRAWCDRLEGQCRAAHADLLDLAPWMRAVHEYVLDASLTRIPTLRELAAFTTPAGSDASARSLAALVSEGVATARSRMSEVAALAAQARDFGAMDFGCLYRRDLGLLATAYHVEEDRLDSEVHDLLASKARLASFIGIAQGQLPQEHWFALGRQLAIVHGEQVLLSHSGALAAYLAPLLLMPTWRNTLLDRSCHAAVRVQMDHARRHGIPWGMSDSSYHAVDAAMRYAYGAFGVPGMALRRGRGDALVVAPYASMLALMVAPEAACANLERLAQLGCLGAYGFYDALDQTAAHLPAGHGRRHAVVRAYTARHQGMGLLALSSLLHDKPMQARFEADPQCRAASLLLQERAPTSGAFEAQEGEAEAPRSPALPARALTRPGAAPEVQLLSNGRYHVMVTGDGGGYSRWGALALTRWSGDAAGFDGGLACYLRDADSGAVWSGAWQPGLGEPDEYEVLFLEERVELRRRDHGIELMTDIVVSPEDDVELRSMRIRNVSGRARRIALTSHADVALAPPAADAAHPAFSKLFVQSEILAAQDAILCTRRPRERGEAAPWLLHLMTVHGGSAGAASFETSREHFLGRGQGLAAALQNVEPLGGHAGAVLDPAVAIRRVLALAPGEEAVVDLVLGAAGTREGALRLVDKYRARQATEPIADLAWTHNQAILRQLDIGDAEARLYARLAACLLYSQRALRADPALIASVTAANTRGQSVLQPYGLSGEQPLVLVQIGSAANLDFVRQLVAAHAWWRRKGLGADLAIWIGSTDDTLHDGVRNLVASRVDAQAIACPGGVYVFSIDGVPPEDHAAMQALASVVLVDERGSLHDQLRRAAALRPALPPALHGEVPSDAWTVRTFDAAPRELVLDNGIGGFSADGREYVIRTGPGRTTPAPWSNVLANPDFGTVVSESGAAYTWSGNAQAFRLTPWHNDPVRDSGGEAFYLRDEHSGVFWSATGAPSPSGGDYLTRHGFGYSVFEHTAHGIHSELTSFVPLDAPLKYAVLRLRNDSSAARRLSATGYVEWVLGTLRAASSMHVVTGRDEDTGALFAQNASNPDDLGSIGFFHVDAAQAAHASFTCDRMEFIGRGRTLAQPAALARAGLSGAVGATLDPCAALQVVFDLQPGEQKELVFLLGAGSDVGAGLPALVRQHRGAQAAGAAFEKLRAWWDETLGAVRIATPDPALDMLANGWLLYQTIACRMWARSSHYQSGGAYSFRDVLQDAMALVHTRPQLLRAQLLACAAHQFVEGDVQHWWHPLRTRGARTRCADDHLWLPLAACRYIAASGDLAVLDEALPWLEGRALHEGEEAYVGDAQASAQPGALYEHCVRAIRHALRFGAHGLPLIGSGDCNEALDRVGIADEGESVWLGFFMAEVLARFAELAERRADFGFATTCRAAGQVLAARLEEHGWDGAWYRRAFFDDGTVLGTHGGAACRIDAMAQSWSVLSGVAPPERAAAAMAAFEAQLVRRDHKLVQLLDPPFDGGDASLDPGTIGAYPPGVRENGGQCTQAAVWAAMAYARLGQGERAWALLDLVNPLRHTATREDIDRYRLEPYALADDVCSAAPHIGRGGWSWYTGSAGWMYRLIVESLLGVERRGERLVLAPQLPCGWPGFRMEYRYRSAVYEIEVRFAEAGALLVDGHAREGNTLDLADDGQRHRVELLVPRRHGPAMPAASEPTQSKSIT